MGPVRDTLRMTQLTCMNTLLRKQVCNTADMKKQTDYIK